MLKPHDSCRLTESNFCARLRFLRTVVAPPSVKGEVQLGAAFQAHAPSPSNGIRLQADVGIASGGRHEAACLNALPYPNLPPMEDSADHDDATRALFFMKAST